MHSSGAVEAWVKGEEGYLTIATSYYAYYLLETRAMVLVNLLGRTYPVVGPGTLATEAAVLNQ
jgi:hypothetical protein